MTTQVALTPNVADRLQDMRGSIALHTRYVHGFWLRRHQLPWCDALEDFSIKRLLIIAPPKFGKSPVVGLDYLGWRIGNDPENYHCIYISNTAGQAHKYNVALRDAIAKNKRHHRLYGLEPDYDKGWSEAEWFVKRKNEADKDPTVQAVGIHGPILGATVQEIILDDPADKENMATPYQREELMDWIQSTAMSRLMPDNNRVIAIMTRWHEDDPAAIWKNAGWHVIELPAIDKDGKPTYPELWNLDALNNARSDANMGTSRFELMFQGNIIPEGGAIFRREWWRYWKQGEAPWQKLGAENKPILAVVQSWDTAFKEKQENDYSACETWGVCENGYYLLNAWRGKLEFPRLKVAFHQLYEQWKPVTVLIEDAASGQDLIAEMRDKSLIPILPIKVSTSKKARAEAVTPMFEAGKVFIPFDASWKNEWEYEHEIFPGGKNDDWLDTTTQFLNWVRTRGIGTQTAPTEVRKQSTWK